MVRHSPEARAAHAAMESLLGRPSAPLELELAQWLGDGVAAAARCGSRTLWPLALWTWIMERAGIHDLFGADPEHAHALCAELGTSSQALRQRPFALWRRGQPGQAGLCDCPGTASARPGIVGRCQLPLSVAATAALEDLAEGARRHHAQLSRAAPTAGLPDPPPPPGTPP